MNASVRWSCVTLVVSASLVTLAPRAGAAEVAGGAGKITSNKRVDPDLWTQRALEDVRRGAANSRLDSGNSNIASALTLLVKLNHIATRDPHAGEMLKLAEAELLHSNGELAQEELRRLVELLKWDERTRQERLALHDWSVKQAVEHAARPEPRRLPHNVAARLREMPDGWLYDQVAPRVVDQMDGEHREAGKWDRLILAYFQLAYDTHRRGHEDRARLYVDRMLGLLREHPVFQEPARGNTNGVFPSSVATLLLETGRSADLQALVAHHTGQTRLELAGGWAAALVNAGRMDEARRVIETEIRPHAPMIADRVEAALLVGSERVVTASRPTMPTVQLDDAAATRMRSLDSAIGVHHARNGRVELAARQIHGGADLAYYEWARLARLAHEGGHPQVAALAFEHALAALPKDTIAKPEEVKEKSQFVREAVSVGAMDLAADVLSSSAPGTWTRYRLGVVYRDRGNFERAHALWEEALHLARNRSRGEGSTMAKIAVELHAGGDVARAEQLLLDALPRIAGEDFGMGGSMTVVRAAVKMGGPELLERVYEACEVEHRFLLATVAAVFGTWDEAKQDNSSEW